MITTTAEVLGHETLHLSGVEDPLLLNAAR
jgi:hypothetical protein